MSQASVPDSAVQAELTKEQKLAAITFIKETTDQLTSYLTGAIRLAHRNAEGCGVDPVRFWKRLFIKKGTHWDRDTQTYLNDKPILTEGPETSEEAVPADPYAALDFQACCKYLLFGGDRIIDDEGNEPRYARDSLLVLQYFGVEARGKHPGKLSGPVGDARQSLAQGMTIRNKSSHANELKLEQEDLRTLAGDLSALETMTQRLFGNREGWEAEAGLDRTLDNYWKERSRAFQKGFGVLPTPLAGLAKELSQIPPLSGWFQKSTRTARSAPAGTDRSPLPSAEQVRRKPVAAADAAQLYKVKQGVIDFRQTADSLLRSFHLLVDESIFLSVEGRNMLRELMDHLDRKTKLRLDKSVVNSLFSQLRGSDHSYTQLEKTVLEEEGVDTAQLEAENQARHKSAKEGLEVLRELRERGLLTVMASPTEKSGSYWNLYRVVEMLPQERFLVITMNADLARRLAEVGGRNAVAAKVNLFGGTLFLYRSTRAVYDRMLGIASSEEIEYEKAESWAAVTWEKERFNTEGEA